MSCIYTASGNYQDNSLNFFVDTPALHDNDTSTNGYGQSSTTYRHDDSLAVASGVDLDGRTTTDGIVWTRIGVSGSSKLVGAADNLAITTEATGGGRYYLADPQFFAQHGDGVRTDIDFVTDGANDGTITLEWGRFISGSWVVFQSIYAQRSSGTWTWHTSDGSSGSLSGAPTSLTLNGRAASIDGSLKHTFSTSNPGGLYPAIEISGTGTVGSPGKVKNYTSVINPPDHSLTLCGGVDTQTTSGPAVASVVAKVRYTGAQDGTNVPRLESSDDPLAGSPVWTEHAAGTVTLPSHGGTASNETLTWTLSPTVSGTRAWRVSLETVTSADVASVAFLELAVLDGSAVDVCGGGGGGSSAQTLSPSTATVYPGDTVQFTANNTAKFGIVANTGNNTGNVNSTGGGSGLTADGGTPSGSGGSIQNGTVTSAGLFTAGTKIGTQTVTAVDSGDDTNTATATITVIPRVVNIPALSSIFHAFLYGPHGARKPLNTNRIRTASWTDERYGGWTGFQMDLNITLEDPNDAAIVSVTDRIELWFYGERRYRGYVTSVVVVEDNPPTLTLNGYGIGFQTTKPIIQHAYIYPHGIDVSQVFAEIVQENVTPLFPALRIEATPIGVLTQQLESTYKSVADTITDLVENQAENLALWGGDADTSGNDRLYIKPFSTAHDWSIPVPGKNVEAAQSEKQTGDVVNRLTILGGNPKYPNLIYNSSFERPRFSNESEGNLVLNANFEEATDWTGTGAYLAADETIGNAFTGARMWQTILDTENGTQTQNPTAIPVVPGWDYVVGAQLKWKTNVGLPEGRITLHWLDSGGSTLQTDTLDTGVLSDGWIPFAMTSRAPSGATGYTLDIRTQSGGDSGNAILWDAIQIAPATVIYQDKWEVDVIGTAAINRLNWAYRDGIDGGYCALIDMTALDTDTDEAYLQPLNGEKFEVTPGAVYTAGVYLKSPPGTTTNGKLRIQIQQYDKDGNEVVIDHINIASGSGWSVWTQEYGTFTIDPTALHAVIKLVWRGTSAVLVDAFSLRDSTAGHGFIRDGQFALQISADQLVLEGYTLSTAAANSVDTYGYRDAVETVDGITEDGEAREYAATYFNVHAPAFPLPTVTVINDRRFFRPGQNVRLIGRDGPTMMDGQDMLPIVKIDWTWDTIGLHAAIQMQKEMPDLASLLKKQVEGASGGGSGSFTSTSAGAAPIPVGTSTVVNLTATEPIEVSPSPIAGTGVISHALSGVTAGTYSGVTITIDDKGHITAITASHLESVILDGEIVLLDGDVVVLEGA